MMLTIIIPITGLLFLNLIASSTAEDCPKTLPIGINGNCYRFQTDPLRFQDAKDNCPKLDANAVMISVKSPDILQKLEKIVYDFITSKLENAVFWIGFFMDDRSLSKAVKDRNWKWNYDDTEIVQKDFSLWEQEGGPTKGGLTCATINASNNFMVMAVDCGGPRIPVICMMKEGEECKHDVAPYLMYGDRCLASLNGALEYNKILGACSPNAPTPVKDEKMKKYVTMAAKNSFLGGGIFMNMRRIGDRFVDLSDGSQPNKDWWEEGEPRDEYDCVGLSLQRDNTLKYKTINCDFLASSLCAYNCTYNE